MFSRLIFGLLFLMIAMVSCQENASNSSITPNFHVTPRTIDPSTLTAAQIARLEHSVAVLMDSSNSVVIKIAESSYTNSQIDTLSQAAMMNLFSPSEINIILDSLESAGDYLDQILGGEPCTGCAYSASQRLNIIQQMALDYRADPSGFLLTTDPTKKKKLFSQGPGCSFEFYVCTALCTTATSGILAAGCVYLCACEFCDYTPPGC